MTSIVLNDQQWQNFFSKDDLFAPFNAIAEAFVASGSDPNTFPQMALGAVVFWHTHYTVEGNVTGDLFIGCIDYLGCTEPDDSKACFIRNVQMMKQFMEALGNAETWVKALDRVVPVVESAPADDWFDAFDILLDSPLTDRLFSEIQKLVSDDLDEKYAMVKRAIAYLQEHCPVVRG